MANNPYVNKVQLADGTSLIDISDTTATASDVLTGRYFYTASGQKVQGSNQGGSGDGYVWQDGNGYVHLSDEQGTQTIIDALTVSSSGTTTAPTGHAYSPVTVPSGTASTPATSVTANPSISVSSGGLITATASATKSVTPSVSAGWVSSGTAGTITVSGSNTSQLSTQAGATITPTESEQTAVASGKYTTGAIKVGAISSSYVGSGITRRDSTDLSASGATVTVPSGYYASNATKTVASGTEGTPTATKGAVSSHSITVTPSVTNTAGYISGGTHNGTAVTVSASELVSGSQTITSNQTVDVTNLAEVVVNVSGGGGLVYEAGTYTPAEDISRPTINFSNAHTDPPILIMMSDNTGTYDNTTYSNYMFTYMDWYKFTGMGFYASSSSRRYGAILSSYRNTSTSNVSFMNNVFNYNSDNASDSSVSYPRYFATSSDFKPSYQSSAYWRAGRTYKWIAVWAPTT